MERTATPAKKKPVNGKSLPINVLSEVVNRMYLSQAMGYQYGGDRDIYQALGYKSQLTYDDYSKRYTRQDIAKAIIDRPVKATWQGPLELIEPDTAEDTEFEEAWEQLDRELGLKTMLSRVDRLTGIGRYGVLLLGLDDITRVEDFKKPVTEGISHTLVYVKPFGEKTAKIETFEGDPKNPRYGKPFIYNIEIQDVASQKSQLVQVHYSRLIHVTDDNLESETYGTPRLEVVFNRLYDLEKLIGGDAEMFWRGARPGYSGKLDPDFSMSEDTKNQLMDQLNEYEHNLRRFLVAEGMELSSLAQQIADPANHVDIQIQMISAVTGIPKRILTGSERGELSSAQDSSEWKDYVQGRREDHAEPRIVRPFVDRLVALQILPTPEEEEYDVKWNDLYSLSEKARVEIGKGRANALREYSTNPLAMEIVPPKAFTEHFLGFTKEQITLINKQRDESISEDDLKEHIEDTVAPPTPLAPAFGGGGKPAPGKQMAKKPMIRTK